jgi:hypothetical protein
VTTAAEVQLTIARAQVRLTLVTVGALLAIVVRKEYMVANKQSGHCATDLSYNSGALNITIIIGQRRNYN